MSPAASSKGRSPSVMKSSAVPARDARTFTARQKALMEAEEVMSVVKKKKQVAVIGAGVAGLVAAKYLLSEGLEPIIYEQRPYNGGLWVQTEVDNAFPSAVYDDHEANVPHQLMAFHDQPWPLNTSLLPGHEAIKQYIQQYADRIPPNIFSHNTEVLEVRQATRSMVKGWKVTTRKTFCKAIQSTNFFDAVIIATGQNNKAKISDFPGLEEWDRHYPGTVSHSMTFRQAEEFRAQPGEPPLNVLMVGGGPSGYDLSALIAGVGARLIISLDSRYSLNPLIQARQVGKTIRFDADSRTVYFAGGNSEQGVDRVILCTGYDFTLPFLRKGCKPLIPDGPVVDGLFEHIFYIPDPTLAFIGLTKRTSPFIAGEAQAAVISRVFAGRIGLPSVRSMLAWEAGPQRVSVDDLKPGELEGIYVDRLHAWSTGCFQRQIAHPLIELPPPRWTPESQFYRRYMRDLQNRYHARREERRAVRACEELGYCFRTWQRNPAVYEPRPDAGQVDAQGEVQVEVLAEAGEDHEMSE